MPADAGALIMSRSTQPPAGIFENAVADLRESLTCQICLKLLYEPFTTSCGHTYCYECLNQWFAGNGDGLKKTCPDCRSRIKQQPAPAFLVRQMVEVLCKRNELLPEGETVEEHTQLREEMVSLVDKHKKDTGTRGGLFEGRFIIPDRANAIWHSDEGIWRCPDCTAELDDQYCGGCDYMFDEEGNPVRNYDDGSSDTSLDDTYLTRDHLVHHSMFNTSAIPAPSANFHGISPFGRFDPLGESDASADSDDDENYSRDSEFDQSDVSGLIDDGPITSEVDSEDEGDNGELTPRHESPPHDYEDPSVYSLHSSPRPGSSDTVREGDGHFSDLEEIPEQEFQSAARNVHTGFDHSYDFGAHLVDDSINDNDFGDVNDMDGGFSDEEEDDDDDAGGYNMAGTGYDSEEDEEKAEEEEVEEEVSAAPCSRKRSRIVLDDSDDEPVRAPQRLRTDFDGAQGSTSRRSNNRTDTTNNAAAYSRSLVVPGASRTATSQRSRTQSANSRHVQLNRTLPSADASASRARLRTQMSSDQSESESSGDSDSEEESEDGSEEDSEEESDEEPIPAPRRRQQFGAPSGFRAPRGVGSGHGQPKAYREPGTQARASAHRLVSRG